MTGLTPLSGHGLWLLPDEPVDAAMRDRIRSLGGPGFEPHATLLGSLPHLATEELAKTARELAHRLAPVTASCEPPVSWTEPWQTLVIPLHPVDAIARQRAQAATAFRLTVKRWRPHMSLYYGSAEGLDASGAGRVDGPVTFSRLALVSLDGLPTSWKILHIYALGGEDAPLGG